jgi:carbonic anhydrase
LNARVVIVMGHENCGAVAAAIDGVNTGYHLNLLLAHIIPAKEAVKNGKMNQIIKKNACIAADHLESKSPIIAEAAQSGQIKIIPAFYHLTSGEVEFLSE